MNDHDCHAMDKPILGCQLLNKEILYSDFLMLKPHALIGLTFKNSPKIAVFIQKYTKTWNILVIQW